MTGTKTPAKVQEKAVVKWKGEQVTITFGDVKNLICPLASDQEAAVFLKTCQQLQLSPFANEVFLIKYNERDKAATVVSINAYLKAAEANDNYNGCQAGIILRSSGGKLEFREGAFLLEEEMDRLAGGWARVYREDRDHPTYTAVSKAECVRYTREGKPTQFWTREKQASMLRKTALKRALVEGFPSLFAGTLSTAEVASAEVASAEVSPDPEAQHEVPEGAFAEGTLPPALEKAGKPDWHRFWARVRSELGLTSEQARELLVVGSIKEDLIDRGVSMEKIWDSLVNALQGQKEAARSEQVVDAQTGEIIKSRGACLSQEEEAPEDEVRAADVRDEVRREAEAVGAEAKRNPETIRSITDLYKACHQDFNLQPDAVLKELGYTSKGDVADTPADCYRQIAVVRGRNAEIGEDDAPREDTGPVWRPCYS